LLYQLRVLLATLFLIVGMLIPPLLLAFAHDLAIHRIISAALTLTLRSAADHMLGTIDGRQKGTQAVKPTPQGSRDESLRRIETRTSVQYRN
jgi:hypothetical protein